MGGIMCCWAGTIIGSSLFSTNWDMLDTNQFEAPNITMTTNAKNPHFDNQHSRDHN